MTVYWDTSAVIHFVTTRRVEQIAGVTRTHTLSELFSIFTGRGWTELMPDGTSKHRRMGMGVAAKAVKDIAGRLTFVDLSRDEVLSALQQAGKLGAQGARVHDLLHAVAADKAKADELWTMDQNDFAGLSRVPIKQI